MELLIVSIILLVILLFLIWSAADISSGVYIKTLCSVKTDKKIVSLTFDDGPEPVYTNNVLNVLNKYNVKAAFFCIGRKADKNPDIIKQILSFGHILGNHSYNHNNNFSILLPHNMRKEILDCGETLKKISGKEIKLFRPPLGVTNPMLAIALRNLDLTTIGWNVRPFDTSLKNAEEVRRKVIGKVKPGSIILMHDRMPFSAEALDLILDDLGRMGYKVVSLDELMKNQIV